MLAVIAPTVETAERPADAGPPPPPNTHAAAPPAPDFDPIVTLANRTPRVSRLAARGPSARHRAGVRPVVAAARQTARRAVQRERERIATVRRAAQSRRARLERAARREVARRTAEHRAQPRRPEAVKRAVRPRRVAGVSARMASVIAFARTQLGKRYESGGEGPYSYDCSGFTKRAYALAGIRLPHSSGAQAARARKISRYQGRPGDLVYGPGHVGVYMGGGMMIDAGNRRTGVVYRRLYAGLRLARF